MYGGHVTCHVTLYGNRMILYDHMIWYGYHVTLYHDHVTLNSIIGGSNRMTETRYMYTWYLSSQTSGFQIMTPSSVSCLSQWE